MQEIYEERTKFNVLNMFSLFQPFPQIPSLKSNKILFQDHFLHQISMNLAEIA